LLVKGRTNPLVHIAANAARDMTTFGREFGMTPSSRTRISLGSSDPSGGKFTGLLDDGA
jgi:phage terminase small subunit